MGPTSPTRIAVLLTALRAHPPRTITRALRGKVLRLWLTPDRILSLVVKTQSTPVALPTSVACADALMLLLALAADVRENDRIKVALGTPSVRCWRVALLLDSLLDINVLNTGLAVDALYEGHPRRGGSLGRVASSALARGRHFAFVSKPPLLSVSWNVRIRF